MLLVEVKLMIKQMHRLLYRQGLTLDAARAAIAELPSAHPEAATDIALQRNARQIRLWSAAQRNADSQRL